MVLIDVSAASINIDHCFAAIRTHNESILGTTKWTYFINLNQLGWLAQRKICHWMIFFI
jgi:hypothetical protein